ncbi:hypothetical protein V8C86DRAFT_2764491 [Haematococcus lacustris]
MCTHATCTSNTTLAIGAVSAWMQGNAFVYGTLMCEDVLKRLIRRVPLMKPAVLQGYSRFKVKGAVYPAIIATTPDALVQGQVLFELSADELKILDQYETSEYERLSVMPTLEDASQVAADVYVWKTELKEGLLQEPWLYEEWCQHHMQQWVSKLAPNEAHPGAVRRD